MKNYSLFFSFLFLLLFWQSNSYGQLVSQKSEISVIEGRPTDLQGCLNVHDTLLIITYWDCAIEDNDTVSLNLNGQWILQKIRLTNAKKELAIKVKPGENLLTLFAHNLGDLPNNTAAFSVREQYAKQEISMTSNMLVSGTTRIACYIGNPGELMNTLAPCVKKEVNTAAADDVKREIQLYEAKMAEANKPKVTPTSNPQPQTHSPAPRPRTKPTVIYHPNPTKKGGTVDSPKPAEKAPAPVKTSPKPPVQTTPRTSNPDWKK